MIRRILTLALLFATSGCNSIYSRPDSIQARCKIGYPVLYPGTRNNIDNIGPIAAATLGFKREETKGNPYFIYPLGMLILIIDTPFSLVMDTVAIKYDIEQLEKCREYRKLLESKNPEAYSQKT